MAGMSTCSPRPTAYTIYPPSGYVNPNFSEFSPGEILDPQVTLPGELGGWTTQLVAFPVFSKFLPVQNWQVLIFWSVVFLYKEGMGDDGQVLGDGLGIALGLCSLGLDQYLQ
jgi:hypothetical protein